ncbi:MAG: NOB1 family endonuclease [Thermoplasmata archaeon]|jgi:UPF0271 protein
MGKKLILDTSAIISGKPFPTDVETFTIESVINEIKLNREYYPILENIKILEIDDESLKKAIETAKKTGIFEKLSKTDLELISAAIKYGYTVVTDDYAIQNVLKFLNLEYMTFSQEGIKDVYIWVYKCKGCKRIYRKNYMNCPYCGSELILTRLKKKNKRKRNF